MSLIHELKRRHLFRAGLAYIALGWVVLQFASIFTPILQLPPWTVRTLLWIGIVGFPVAMWCAWHYQMTPEGLKRRIDVRPEESNTGMTRRKLNRAILSFLIAALVLVLAERLYLLSQAEQQPAATSAPAYPG